MPSISTISADQLLADILSRAALVSSDIQTGINTVRSNSAKLEDSYTRDSALQRQNADASALVVLTQQQGRLAVETSLKRTAAQFGADLEDASGLQAKLAQDYLSAKADQRAALEVINKKKSTSFFSDPLSYIVNQFTIDSDIEKHNAANAKAQAAASQIEETNKLLDQRAIAANRLQTTVTQASAEAAAQAAKNQALIVADDYFRQGVLANTKSVQDIIALRSSDMQIAATSYDAANKQIQTQVSLENLRLSKEAAVRDAERLLIAKKQLEMSAEHLNIAKAAELRQSTVFQQTQAAGEYVQNAVILGYKTLYPNQPQKWEVPNSPKMLALMSGKIPLDGELKAAFELGVINSKLDPEGRIRILGTSPIDTLKNLQYRPELGPDTKPVIQLMTDTAQEVINSAKYKQLVQAKDVEGANKLVNDTVNQVFAQQAALVKDPSNPYYLPNISEIVKQSPGLNDLKIVQKIIVPFNTAGIDMSNPNVVFQAGLKAVANKEITLNDFAVELSTIYRQGQRVNIASKQLSNFGIAPIESYNVKVNLVGMFDTTVNLASPTEIIRAAMQFGARARTGPGSMESLLGVPSHEERMKQMYPYLHQTQPTPGQ